MQLFRVDQMSNVTFRVNSLNGKTVVMNGKGIYVDGKLLGDASDTPNVDLKIVVPENSRPTIEAGAVGNVHVQGSCASVSSVSGTVTVEGDVKGNASSVSGTVLCHGAIGGGTSTVSGTIQTNSAAMDKLRAAQRKEASLKEKVKRLEKRLEELELEKALLCSENDSLKAQRAATDEKDPKRRKVAKESQGEEPSPIVQGVAPSPPLPLPAPPGSSVVSSHDPPGPWK